MSKVLSTNEEYVHIVKDSADEAASRSRIAIQCDRHGLTMEFPGGQVLVVDLSGVFKLYLTEAEGSKCEEVATIAKGI
jgi:hypothetical protein